MYGGRARASVWGLTPFPLPDGHDFTPTVTPTGIALGGTQWTRSADLSPSPGRGDTQYYAVDTQTAGLITRRWQGTSGDVRRTTSRTIAWRVFRIWPVGNTTLVSPERRSASSKSFFRKLEAGGESGATRGSRSCQAHRALTGEIFTFELLP